MEDHTDEVRRDSSFAYGSWLRGFDGGNNYHPARKKLISPNLGQCFIVMIGSTPMERASQTTSYEVEDWELTENLGKLLLVWILNKGMVDKGRLSLTSTNVLKNSLVKGNLNSNIEKVEEKNLNTQTQEILSHVTFEKSRELVYDPKNSVTPSMSLHGGVS